MTDRFMPALESTPSRRNDILKLIALITMLVDHIGAIFFPGQMLWRTIGRIAFPIFAWQLTQGFIHTSSRVRYGFRLFLFGIIAQAPYMFLNPDVALEPLRINIMFQLFSGVLLLAAVEYGRKGLSRFKSSPVPGVFMAGLGFLAAGFLIAAPDLANAWHPELRFSYGTYGQLMFLVFYSFRGRPVGMALGYGVLSLFHGVEAIALWQTGSSGAGLPGLKAFFAFWTTPGILADSFVWSLKELPGLNSVYFQARSLIALPIIWLFDSHPGKLRLNRWLGYWFYPVHMAVLVGIRWFMLQQ